MLAKQETSLLHRHQSSACSRLPAAPCASVAASRSLNQQCRRQRTMCMAAWEGEQQQVPSSEVLGLPPPPALHQQQQRQHQHQQQQQQQPDGTPHSTLQRVLEVVRAGNLDGMLEFCSDEVIDKLLALKKQTGWVGLLRGSAGGHRHQQAAVRWPVSLTVCRHEHAAPKHVELAIDRGGCRV